MARHVIRLIGAALLLASVGVVSAQRAATVRGVVRDAQGVPQMGVAVQLVGHDAQVAGNSFTDLNGRFLIGNLLPGVYQLRATATLYLPVLRNQLQLHSGDLSTVNLTLSGLFEQAWPVSGTQHRGDLADDWRWTLRSSANRPLLRVFDQEPVAGPEAGEGPRSSRVHRNVAAVDQAGGRFGASGLRTTVQRQSSATDRSSTWFAGLGLGQNTAGSAGVDAAVGLERHGAFAPTRKAAIRLRSEAAVSLPGQADGTSVLDAAAGERMQLGDSAEIEAGALLRAVRSGQTAIVSYPFLRARVDAGSGWELGYSLAGSPDCQGLDDVGREPGLFPAAAIDAGRLRLERGMHQAVSVQHHLGRGVLEATVERDALKTIALSGGGGRGRPLPAQDVALSGSEMVDGANGMFRQLEPGYAANGVRVLLSYPMGRASVASVEYIDGTGLALRPGAVRGSVGSSAAPQRAQGVRVTAQSNVQKTGTRFEAGYNWQPEELVTLLSPFSGSEDGAYLSVHLRQPVHARGLVPEGTVVTVDGSNLAQQGYIVLAAADPSEAAVLASTMRSLQAGLSFTF